MKERIIVKYKKLKDGVIDSADSSSREDQDVADAIKNGTLLMEDHIDGSWSKHYFVLTRDKVS